MARADILRNITAGHSRVAIAAGVVTAAPGDRTSPVSVALASRPDHTIADTPHWNRDGDHLPQPGDTCVLLLSPDVDPVVIWSPSE